MVIMMNICTLTTTNDQSWGIISRNELRRTVSRFGESLSINIKPSPISAEITGTLLPRNILQILFLGLICKLQICTSSYYLTIPFFFLY